MSQIIIPRRHEDVTEYSLTCEHTDKDGNVIERGWGFRFECDAKGNPLTMSPCALANLAKIRDGSIPTNGLTLVSCERVIHHSPVLQCDCGAKLVLNDSWANSCDCGREFNGSGQELAPRSQWGEETGEQGDF